MFKAARKEAFKSEFAKFHYGAVIVYKKNIIAVGHNKEKTHPFQKHYNKYRPLDFINENDYIKECVHAEIDAISHIPYVIGKELDKTSGWSDVSIYVYRVSRNKNKRFAIAKPCEGCFAAIKDLGIKDIYYTDREGYSYLRLS